MDNALLDRKDTIADCLAKLVSCAEIMPRDAESQNVLIEQFSKAMLTLHDNIVEQSVYVTIHTLFDLGLLTQGEPE